MITGDREPFELDAGETYDFYQGYSLSFNIVGINLISCTAVITADISNPRDYVQKKELDNTGGIFKITPAFVNTNLYFVIIDSNDNQLIMANLHFH